MGQLQYTRNNKMKLKDKTMKEFLENNAYFVDFFNAYFFDGERVLKPENCYEVTFVKTKLHSYSKNIQF